MHLRSEGFGLFVALTGLLLCVPASAQQPQSSPAQTPNGTSRVLVTDGLPVWPRIAEDVQFVGDGPFRIADGVHVFEDGVKQPGATLQKAAQPASICLMIDVSSSMKESGPDVIAAAQRFVRTANPADEIEIVRFSWPAYVERRFTTDSAALVATLQGLHGGKGGTAFFDALQASVKEFETEKASGRRVLVIFSDGNDNASTLTFTGLLKDLRKLDVPLIYCGGLPSQGELGRRNLDAISKVTGGFVFGVRDATSMNDAAAQISQDIHSRYRLEYISTHAQKDGRLHKIEVRIQPAAGASKIKTVFRQEYYAPSQ